MKTEANFACDNYVCLTLTGIITSFAIQIMTSNI